VRFAQCCVPVAALHLPAASALRGLPQTEEAKQLGIFGAPSFTTADGELFWGNDRLERAIAWAKDAKVLPIDLKV
jgi:hypothetical protein